MSISPKQRIAATDVYDIIKPDSFISSGLIVICTKNAKDSLVRVSGKKPICHVKQSSAYISTARTVELLAPVITV